MSYDPQNVFARILRDELPCVRLFEDEYTLAFMDLMPQTESLQRLCSSSRLKVPPPVCAPRNMLLQL
jgi:hypothetical protein